MILGLPKSVEIDGVDYAVRYDYRVIIEICIALEDIELTEQEKAIAALAMFYPDVEQIPAERLQEAVERCIWFINCGQPEDKQKSPRLVDWEQDFQHIVSPVNRVLGQEIRSIPYDVEQNTEGLHWWTFISAYNEIGGDCVFAQIVRTRNKLARGKKLDKQDSEWYKQNRNLVDFRRKYTDGENDVLKQWGAK